MTRRHFWAWLLLLAVSIQWVGGVIFVRLTYTSLIKSEMNAAEEDLADKVAEAYGVRARVRILNEAEQQSILNAGYGTPFLFSHEDEDSTDYFTVERDQSEWVTHEYLINGPQRNENTGKALLSLNQLFSPYIINNTFPLKPVVTLPAQSGNFAYHPLADLFALQVPTPPPSLRG